MTRKQKRLAGIASIALIVGLAGVLAAIALRDEIVFFYEPTDVVVEGKVKPGQNFRIGGLVEEGSVSKEGRLVKFRVTDGDNVVAVTFDGIVPDLFREGQGVIAEGALDGNGVFLASNVLAKHDENYIPRELQDTLKKKNVWQGESQ